MFNSLACYITSGQDEDDVDHFISYGIGARSQFLSFLPSKLYKVMLLTDCGENARLEVSAAIES